MPDRARARMGPGVRARSRVCVPQLCVRACDAVVSGRVTGSAGGRVSFVRGLYPAVMLALALQGGMLHGAY